MYEVLGSSAVPFGPRLPISGACLIEGRSCQWLAGVERELQCPIGKCERA